MSLALYHAPRMSCCPKVMRLARRANKVMLAKGHTSIKETDGSLEALFHYDTDRRRMAGMIGFFRSDKSEYYVQIAWVEPTYRKQGLLKHLFKALAKYARRNGSTMIATEVSGKNQRMLELMGRHWSTSYVYFTKPLKKTQGA